MKFILLLILLTLFGCSTSDIERVNSIASEAHHVGKIIEKDEARNRILVDEILISIDRNEPSLIWFKISDETILVDADENKVDYTKLGKGDLVEVWNDGVILHSYPGQGLATKIKMIP